MLDAQRYPYEHEPYSKTPKTLAFEAAARKLGQDWFLPSWRSPSRRRPAPPVPGEPIDEPLPNLHGRTRQTCRLVGECDIGCNYGAKNTLDYNYLTAARRAGAEIRTRSEVRSFEPRDGGGYAIHYVEHDPEREGEATDTSALPQLSVSADRLVLSAGTLGTTYLLLKNRAAFPGLSPRLGTRFCGNGDLLTFAVRCTRGRGGRAPRPRRIEAGYGPVITSAVRVATPPTRGPARAAASTSRTRAIPSSRAGSCRQSTSPRCCAGWRRRWSSAWSTACSAAIATPTSAPRSRRCSATSDCRPACCRCSAWAGTSRTATMSLADGRLEVDWSKHGASKDYFDRVRDLSRQIAEELGGEVLDDPLWYLNRVITVHPLGGCPMGRTAEEGVVDRER